MSDEPFNSERQQAEQLDKWITAAQADNPPQNDTVAELRQFIEMGREIRADEIFVRQLEAQITQRYRRKRRIDQWRWSGAAAAVMLVIVLAAGVLRVLSTSDQPQPTGIVPSTTPVALAATSALAVEINQTFSATATPVSTATATLTATPTPAAETTIVPAINPTAPVIFPSMQIDVVFVVDSGVGLKELENSLVNLPGQSAQTDIRFGLVMASKGGVQTVDLTRDRGALATALQAADPIGDGFDTWGVMLNEALTGVGWRGGSTSRVIIGLATRPPGEDYVQVVREMAAQGMTLHVIALGDMDEQDASIFRDMTQITGGHFAVLDGSSYTLDQWIAQWIIALPSG